MNTVLKTLNFILAIVFVAFCAYGFNEIHHARKLDENSNNLISLIKQKTSNIENMHIIFIEKGINNSYSTKYQNADNNNPYLPHKKKLKPKIPIILHGLSIPFGSNVVSYWAPDTFSVLNNEHRYNSAGSLMLDSMHLDLFTSILDAAKNKKKLKEGIVDSPNESFILISTDDIPFTSWPPPIKQVKRTALINDKPVKVIAVIQADDSAKYILMLFNINSETSDSITIKLESEKGEHKRLSFSKENLKYGAFLVKNND